MARRRHYSRPDIARLMAKALNQNILSVTVSTGVFYPTLVSVGRSRLDTNDSGLLAVRRRDHWSRGCSKSKKCPDWVWNSLVP